MIDGLVEDLSRSGLFLRAHRSAGSDEVVEITLELPGSESLKFMAEVVRVQSEPHAGMGLRLVGDPDQVRRSLANFIMRQHATSR